MYCKSLTKVNFEENSKLKEISANAFYKCEKLNSVTIPNGVTTIGNYAFCGCGLKKVTIPKSVTMINKYVFQDCKKLEEVIIPKSVTMIDKYAFKDCENLREVKFEEGLQLIKINEDAFDGCTSLGVLTIPRGYKYF